MKNNIIILCMLMLAVSSVSAQTLVNPAGQSLEGAAKNQLENAAEQKMLQAAPGGVQQGVQEVEAGKSKLQQVQQLNGTLNTTHASPGATGVTGGIGNAIEGKARQEAADKAIDLLK